MKTKYRHCNIEVTREKCLAGYYMTYYSIFTEDGFEVTSSYTEGDTIQSMTESCKEIVDDYLENPEDYE